MCLLSAVDITVRGYFHLVDPSVCDRVRHLGVDVKPVDPAWGPEDGLARMVPIEYACRQSTWLQM